MTRIYRRYLGMFLSYLAVGAMVLLPSPQVSAQVTQIKPRILIVFDTSGSMARDIEGYNTRGDGSMDPWPGGGYAYPGSGESRLYIAKEAMTKMLLASGDIDFALMKFVQEYNGPAVAFESTFYENNQTAGTEDWIRYTGYTTNATGIPIASLDWDFSEDNAANWRCVDFGETSTAEILTWIDHHEFSLTSLGDPDNSIFAGPHGDYLEQELRADGETPLGEALQAAYNYILQTMQDDSVAACRPYSVIILTDGAANGDVNPENWVENLYSIGSREGTLDSGTRVDSWVIGLAYNSNTLDDMAAKGGAHYDPNQSGNHAFLADSQESLTSVLYSIVADSVRQEECNYKDDDCNCFDDDSNSDGQICGPGDEGVDEGFPKFCDMVAAGGDTSLVPAEDLQEFSDAGVTPDYSQKYLCYDPGETLCDGVDDNCNGETDEGDWTLDPNWGTSCGASNVGQCSYGELQCSPGEGWVCVGEVTASEEVCDGIDNDCDGETDEVEDIDYMAETGAGSTACTVSPYGDTGECSNGTYQCVSGAWSCTGGQGPTLEGTACDGMDNDCDGETDEGITQPCGGGPESHENDGLCREGIQYCDTVHSTPDNPMWLDCAGNIDPQSETCNGFDDNCDGFVDNGLTTDDHDWIGQTCGGGSIPGLEDEGWCQSGTWECVDGGKKCCVGGAAVCDDPVGPRSESGLGCNGIDDDCDGTIDEGLRDSCWEGKELGEPSYGEEGQCVLGWRVCVQQDDGTWDWGICEGTVGPSDEVCDGIDNDCDGSVDEDLELGSCGGAPSGDPDEGECVAGTLVCSEGRLECQDEVPPVAETCNDKDDDCDGTIDEGLYEDCWEEDYDPIGICRAGVKTCAGGIWGACEGQVTRKDSELCNGLDDDCDGVTDEEPMAQVGETCNQCGDVWECRDGDLFCAEANSEPEVCDGIDNDCDGLVDEVTNPCGGCDGSGLVNTECAGPDGANEGQCRQGVQYCDSDNASPDNPVWHSECVGSIGPTAEICDAVDNDCDGVVDEEEDIAITGQQCAQAVGRCEEGFLRCVSDGAGGKTLDCCRDVDENGNCIVPVGPTNEVCNGWDDDCNSLTDENLRVACGGCDPAVYPDFECPVGPDAGECVTGVRLCVAQVGSGVAAWGECQGDQGPVAEQCNLLDDDCDGEVDEGVAFEPADCSHSVTDDPNEGICEPGQWVCKDGRPECDGGVKPTLEECDGLDNDCDGEIDEDIPHEGEACGTNVGICQPGVLQCLCDGDECGLECVGGTSGVEEECNCLDDDCDGRIDEDIPLGATCTNSPTGEPQGECDEGNMQCIDCEWQCGANEPSGELCDGLDNDCDGEIDENLAVECPEDNICIAGECAPPCAGTEQACPPSKTCVPIDQDGETFNICVEDVCNSSSEKALDCVTNPYFCSDSEDSPPCMCDNVQRACIPPCNEESCPEHLICVAEVVDGEAVATCREPTGDCYTEGCEVNEVCRDAQCVPDPCADVTCSEGEYCNEQGDCVGVCVDMDCSCFEGECVDDPCAGVTCPPGMSCDSDDGKCHKGGCWGVACEFYEVCEEQDGKGVCVEDPCYDNPCPPGLECLDGACYGPDQVVEGEVAKEHGDQDTSDNNPDDTEDGGWSTDTEPSDKGASGDEMNRILATGTGGCLCSAAPGRGSDSGWVGLLALVFVIGWAARRKLRRAGHIGAVTLFAAAGLWGCDIQPYEFPGAGGTDTEIGGTTTDTDGTEHGTSSENLSTDGTDTQTGSGTDSDCQPGEPDDDCDGIDDDCDGKIDEDVDLTSSVHHCGKCGNDCTVKYQHAFAECVDGTCGLDKCETFWYDEDGKDSNGCEYYCQPTVDPEDNLDLCDGVDLEDPDNPYKGIDNDCDGKVDEDVQLQIDPMNCGACGKICRFSNAEGSCEDGACVVGACEEDYYDRDLDPSNGCEYHCVIVGDGTETCNGIDDDCDGVTDEDDDDPASPYGADGGAECYTATDGGCSGNPPVCKGACAPGHLKCELGKLVCKGMTRPAPQESCDNIDNDCDGEVDEEADIPLVGPGGALCGSNVGECQQGRRRCARENVGAENTEVCCVDVDQDGVCVPPSAPEAVETLCDGMDNDCDGLIDENPDNAAAKMNDGSCVWGQIHGEQPPEVLGQCAVETGLWTCYWGQWLCEGAGRPEAESCNNLDDNCDGQTDEGLYQSCKSSDYEEQGICRAGLSRCVAGVWGACENEIAPQPELCDGLDNDCDGVVDENLDVAKQDNRIGKTCGVGVCSGTQICRDGLVVCEGAEPDPNETPCNGKDDDCDGSVDEWDSFLCGGCDGSGDVNTTCESGPNAGRCQQGTWVCEAEGPVCKGTIAPEIEACDGYDNDCDGLVDESPDDPEQPITAGACGVCGDGVITCTSGTMVCVGASVPSPELCDGENNDCNELTPDGAGEVWYGDPCDGDDADLCNEGVYQCVETAPGVWGQVCSDTTGDSVEECNGIDDDCDGETDEGVAEPVGGACNSVCGGNNIPSCTSSGWVCDYQCTDEGGVVECDASGNPMPEETICDGYDNDCDGEIDETFNTDYDVSNCGGCGNDCTADGSLWAGGVVPTNANLGCQNGTCRILTCETGWVGDECDYECTVSNGGVEICDEADNDCDGETDENAVTEVCDGEDNDCDGQTDEAEDLTLPPGECRTAGACSAISAHAACVSGSWVCNYEDLPDYEADETTCDGVDNDCDGQTDEGYPQLGAGCRLGTGACAVSGTYRCNEAGNDEVCCTAATAVCAAADVASPGAATPEICDGLDNDCDGVVDVGAGESGDSAGVDYVTITDGSGNSYDIFVYEASRPDADEYATSDDGGALATAACSIGGRVPWTMVTKTEAEQACWNLNDSGTQEAGGWDLCSKGQWAYACGMGGSNYTLYPYGDTYGGSTCNGHDYNSSWDHLIGAGDAGMCIASWDQDVYDMSGNLEEWTRSSRDIGSTVYEIRGGSFNDQEDGLKCSFDFWAAEPEFRMPNLGFRCCRGSEPVEPCAGAIAALTAVPQNFNGCSTPSGWTLEGEWEVGNPSGNGSPSAYDGCLLAVDRDGKYSKNQNIYATSPSMALQGCRGSGVTIDFRMWYDIENPSDGMIWDALTLEVWNGTSWVILESWSGANTNWNAYSVEVPGEYLSGSFKLRFLLRTDEAVTDFGPYIDNLTISAN